MKRALVLVRDVRELDCVGKGGEVSFGVWRRGREVKGQSYPTEDDIRLRADGGSISFSA